ncbi:AraC family transcriptional regulator [Chryseobacterium sp.]|uniref:AraC family transcriptional regulator n=1 Tax=Chryseobacterium sp. TaxID=1871047 RepID=UPI00289FCD68|nr:AraC family transcriptional regulator [Chryseobacterium sp.]
MLKLTEANLKKIISIIFFFVYAYSYSLTLPEPKFSKKYTIELTKNEKEDVKYFTFDRQYIQGKRLLRVSNSDAEFAAAYGNMGYAKYKLFQYSKAIPLMEKAKEYAYKSNFVRYMFGMNLSLKDTYLKTGLKQKSDECWKELLRIANKYNDDNLNFSVYDVYANDFEKVKKYEKAIYYRKKQLDLIKKNSKNELLHAEIKGIIAYDYLKIDDISNAHKYISDASKIIDDNKKKYEVQELEFYYMVKALFACQNKDIYSSKKYFELALDKAKSKNNKDNFILISEELVKTNIDFPKSRLVFEDYINNQNLKAGEVEKVIKQDEKLKRSEIKRYNSFAIYLSISVTILLIAIAAILFINKRKNKKLVTKVEKILQEAKNKEAFYNTQILQVSDSPQHIIKEKKPELKTDKKQGTVLSEEREKELLSKIEMFEKGEDFIRKGFTMTQMAALLESNAVYINFVLQKYRDKKFNDYINEIKVKYIVKKLVDNPEYLNYKISYLSELCGFGNHSHFTQIFKKELGISPSEFILGLSKKSKG